MKLRLATHEDGPHLIELLEEMHAEVGMFPLDRGKMIQKIVELLGTGAVIVAEDAGGIIGSIGLAVEFPWYSASRYVGDNWFYVRKDARREKVGEHMIEFAKVIARKAYDLPLILGPYGEVNTEIKARWYRKQGGKNVGQQFRMTE